MTTIPPALKGPGRIVKRQTTHWLLEVSSEETFRVEFRGKKEFIFADEHYPSAVILDQHPLLRDFHEPHQVLYVSGTPSDPVKLAKALNERIRRDTGGWRTLSRYGNMSPEAILEGGHGLLMRAPESICAAASDVLEQAGIAATTPGLRAKGGQQKLLLLGQSYVVADEFRFQRV